MTRKGRKIPLFLFCCDESIQLQKRFDSVVTPIPQWNVIKIFDNDYTFQCLQIKIVFRYHHFVTQETKKLIYFLTKGHVKKQGGYFNLILTAIRGLNKAVYNWAEILMKSKLSFSFGNKLIKLKCPHLLNVMLSFIKTLIHCLGLQSTISYQV